MAMKGEEKLNDTKRMTNISRKCDELETLQSERSAGKKVHPVGNKLDTPGRNSNLGEETTLAITTKQK